MKRAASLTHAWDVRVWEEQGNSWDPKAFCRSETKAVNFKSRPAWRGLLHVLIADRWNNWSWYHWSRDVAKRELVRLLIFLMCLVYVHRVWWQQQQHYSSETWVLRGCQTFTSNQVWAVLSRVGADPESVSSQNWIGMWKQWRVLFTMDLVHFIAWAVHSNLFQITSGPPLWVLNKTLSISNSFMLVGSQLSLFLLHALPSCWDWRAHPFPHSLLTAVASVFPFPAWKGSQETSANCTVIKSQVWILSQGSAWVKSQAQQQGGCFRSGNVPHVWALSTAELIAELGGLPSSQDLSQALNLEPCGSNSLSTS